MSNQLAAVDVQKYEKEVTELEQKALSLPIKTDRDVVQASETVVDLKSRLKKFKDFFTPIVDAAHQAHKKAKAGENLVCAPLERAAKTLSNRVAVYQDNQKRIADEKEQKAREAAQKKEDEKKDKLLEEAAQAEEKGDSDKAEQLIDKADNTYVAPRPVKAAVKTNTSIRYVYEVTVLNQAQVPDMYKIVDEAKIKRMAAASADGRVVTLNVPGCKIVARPIGATRTR